MCMRESSGSSACSRSLGIQAPVQERGELAGQAVFDINRLPSSSPQPRSWPLGQLWRESLPSVWASEAGRAGMAGEPWYWAGGRLLTMVHTPSLTADLAQSVRAPDCGSGGRGFESHNPPLFVTVLGL